MDKTKNNETKSYTMAEFERNCEEHSCVDGLSYGRLRATVAERDALRAQLAEAQRDRALVVLRRLVDLHDVKRTRPDSSIVSWSNSAAALEGVGSTWAAALLLVEEAARDA